MTGASRKWDFRQLRRETLGVCRVSAEGYLAASRKSIIVVSVSIHPTDVPAPSGHVDPESKLEQFLTVLLDR